jgi:hypothetical protein
MINTAYWPVWLAILLSGLAGIYQVITEFQKIANLFGKFGRGIYERSRARHRMDTKEFHEAVRVAVEEERERWEVDEARALTVVKERLEYFIGLSEQQQAELIEMRWYKRVDTAYGEYESEWHHRLRLAILRASKNGGAIPIEILPEHIHRGDFERMCREKDSFNWRTWGIL